MHKQLLAGAEAEGVDRAHLQPHLTTYTVSYLVGNQEIFSFILLYSPKTWGGGGGGGEERERERVRDISNRE